MTEAVTTGATSTEAATEVTTKDVTTEDVSTEDASSEVNFDDLEEEASSAIEEIDNVIDDVVEDDTVNGIIDFIQRLWQSVLDFFSNLSF
jgi:hypothetical protein